MPPIAGLNLKNVFTFVTWDDIEKLQKIAAPTKKAVVIGAGLIGLKAAESLTKIGVKVTVIELADYALSTVLDKGSAQIIQSVFEKAGVNFYFQTTVDEISGYNKAEKVKLRNGMELDCDFVVVAIGVIPNIELVKKSEFKTKRGILVDQYLQTNVEGIYAAGDVAEVYDPATDQYLWRPILPNAVRQGKIAGRNMSGEKVEFDNVIALNATTFFDLPVVSLGMSNVVDEKYEILEQRNDTENLVKRIVLQNEVVVGTILVGKIDRAGIFRGLIKNRLNVRDFKEQLLKPDFGLIHLPKEYWYKEFTGEKI
ncbi:FAD-dependent oxidoreductase [bacterium]|nr:FAD-dependent oxidoreductase [bacterium]